MTKDDIIRKLTAPGGDFELRETKVNSVPMRVYTGAPESMREILQGTRQFAEREFLVYESDRWTYGGHFRTAAALARLFVDRGIRKGDRVAIGMRNYPEWVASFWACQAIGAVAVTLNAWWTGEELEYALTDSGARAAVLDGERVQRVVPYLNKVPLEFVLGVRDAEASDHVELLHDALVEYAGTEELPEAEIQPDDPATLMYTSGTTGRPKGTIGTHRNHVTNLVNTFLLGAVAQEMAPPDAPPPPEQPVALQTFPFFHIGGLTGLYVTTGMGGKLVLMYKWDADKALDLIESEGIMSMSGVPSVVRQLLERAAKRGRELPSMAGIASGGAPVPPDLIENIGSQFERQVAPSNGYGLTETTSAVIFNSAEDYFDHPGSIGRPMPTADAKVVSEDGTELGTSEVGEIWVRGPNIVPGYWNRPEATAESFTDGWFHSGDLGYRDEDGYYYVVDRIKDVVLRGGENVYCAEVEAVIFRHPAVEDVAVIGLPHRELGEEVAAVIQPREGSTLDPEELKKFVGQHLARFKVPSRVLVTDEPLPRTATGKVLKRDLKSRYSEGRTAHS